MSARIAASLPALVLALAILLCPGHAAAQTQRRSPAPSAPSPGAETRGFISGGAGLQFGTHDFSDTHASPLYGEMKTWTADYSVNTGPEFEVAGGWRLWRRLFAGAAYSHFSDSGGAAITARIPHPFFFEQPRDLSGESADLSHRENGLHLSATWVVPAARRVDVAVFGGPSILSVSRALVKDVEFSETYPFDTVTLAAAPAADTSGTSIGFHVGGDVTYALTPRIGAGVTLRYTRATVDLDAPAGGIVTVTAGGLQVAASIQLRFVSKAAGPRAHR